MEERIATIMKSLKCSREEALEIIADDEAIDHGEEMWFDLDEDAEKVAKTFARTGEKTAKSERKERKPKENPQKEQIIAEIARFLVENGYESAEITNKTRQIAFKVGEKSFELTLIEKRPPKK
jgi:hypothetical protein